MISVFKVALDSKTAVSMLSISCHIISVKRNESKVLLKFFLKLNELFMKNKL
jgi:hypothetical protein